MTVGMLNVRKIFWEPLGKLKKTCADTEKQYIELTERYEREIKFVFANEEVNQMHRNYLVNLLKFSVLVKNNTINMRKIIVFAESHTQWPKIVWKDGKKSQKSTMIAVTAPQRLSESGKKDKKQVIEYFKQASEWMEYECNNYVCFIFLFIFYFF
jgi:hypothetical protein